MIITKTPYRLSFFGGGTDYPDHYMKNGGAVLATSINKYCYITCRVLPPFFDHKFRIAYSRIENAKTVDGIEHPAVRGVLHHLNLNLGLEIHHDGDLPARSGLGSSSSFTVGLLKALYALQGQMKNNFDIALEAIKVEQDVIGEKVGSQDQISAAVGGLNHIRFNADGSIVVEPVIIPNQRRDELASHIMMFYTGVSRYSQSITTEKIKGIKKQPESVMALGDMVTEGLSILTNQTSEIRNFGLLMDESWKIKRELANNVTNPSIDSAYEVAKSNGAWGGKIMGAGGGGFLAVFAPPERHESIKNALNGMVHVPFDFDYTGSSVCVYEPNGL